MKRKTFWRLVILTFLLFVLMGGGMVMAAPEDEEPEYRYARGQVTTIIDETKEKQAGMDVDKQIVEVQVLDGELEGETRIVEHIRGGPISNPAYNFTLHEGDKVVLALEVMGGEVVNVYLDDLVREGYVKALVCAFCVLLVVFGGIKGIKALVALGLTIIAILKIMLPQILLGNSPLLLAVLVSVGVSILTLLIVGGINGKSLAAIIGTSGGVLAAGIIASLVGAAATLSGLEEESVMLMSIPQQVDFNFRGLLVAGIIIGALGAMMDVGMSIASAVEEVKKANPALGIRDLFNAGMNVGRDVMGTMTNTLVLAYTGSALPLLLLFLAHDVPLVKIINMDSMVSEVLRALAGSIGLILAIPITAVSGSFLSGLRPNKKQDKDIIA